jgi:hypothetical protein
VGSTGVPYSLTLAATGGSPAYTWALESGVLPLGMSLAPSTGILSGTTQVTGVYTFTIRITDSVSATATKLFTLAITQGAPQGALQLSDTSLDFFGLVGGDSPAPRTLSLVGSPPSSLPFTVQIDGGAPGKRVSIAACSSGRSGLSFAR